MEVEAALQTGSEDGLKTHWSSESAESLREMFTTLILRGKKWLPSPPPPLLSFTNVTTRDVFVIDLGQL
jgi:hypothetical protein